jgi:hypothetical protein
MYVKYTAISVAVYSTTGDKFEVVWKSVVQL